MEILSLRRSSYSTVMLNPGRDSAPEDRTHPLDCVTAAVVYQVNTSISMEVGMENHGTELYMSSTPTHGPGDSFLMAVLGDQARRVDAELFHTRTNYWLLEESVRTRLAQDKLEQAMRVGGLMRFTVLI